MYNQNLDVKARWTISIESRSLSLKRLTQTQPNRRSSGHLKSTRRRFFKFVNEDNFRRDLRDERRGRCRWPPMSGEGDEIGWHSDDGVHDNG